MLFSSIEDAVLQGECDFGVIIHENRFTYAAKGLQLVNDLGNYWEGSTGLPIPLGAIAAKRTLPLEKLKMIDHLIKESVTHAFQHQKQSLSNFIKQHAQEMDESVMRQHIDLYVNEYSVNMGEKGKQAIRWLYHESIQDGISISDPLPGLNLFTD
jgi:1,4-dihydroxy-6-naphthoate synthase